MLILDYSNFNQQVYDIDLDQNETGDDFLINKETLSQIDKFKLINIKSSNKNLKVFIQDLSFALREIKGNYKTYNLNLDGKTYFLKLSKFTVLESLSVNETLGTKEYLFENLTSKEAFTISDLSNIPNPEFADDIVKLLLINSIKGTSFYGERLHPLSGEIIFIMVSI